MKVSASPLPGVPPSDRPLELTSIVFEPGQLRIVLEGHPAGGAIAVRFRDVEGYRILDEGRLPGFWPACSTPNGSMFEVSSGGWLEELRESPSRALWASDLLKEFFVPGVNDCASVIAYSAPEVVLWPL